MKTFYRVFSLICLLGITVFSKQDIQSEYTIPEAASSVFATNIYHNGFNDIIVGHHTWVGPGGAINPSITILKNVMWGNFEITDTSKVFSGFQDNIFAVDVNNDGWADIITFHTTVSSWYLRVYYNINGSFPNDNFVDFSLNSASVFDGITFGDINGDGFMDLAVISSNDNFWGILNNTGNGSFTAPVYFSIQNPYDIKCDDLNGDGRDDIVISGQNTMVYFSYPTGFQSLILDTNAYMQNPQIVDFDLDGKKDILTEVYEPWYHYSILRMFKNSGNNTFQKMPDIFYPYAIGGLHTVDFNNDGYPDVLYAGVGGHTIWYNQGNFQLTDSQFVEVPYYGERGDNIAFADLDNNGFNDIITVRFFDYSEFYPALDIRFNDGHGNFTPDPIVGLKKLNNNNTVFLQSFPNPFQSNTLITFDLKDKANVELSICNEKGQFIKCLISQKLDRGSYSIKWCGLDNDDQSCKPGVYIAYLKVKGKISGSVKVFKI
jgi:hypothetical protein